MSPKSLLAASVLALASVSFAAPAPPVVASFLGATSHGLFSGIPTTTGALSTSVLAASIPALPPNPTATTYPSDGQLHDPQPAPYTPAGGLGTNGTEPVYNVKSDFDYESLVWTRNPLSVASLTKLGTCTLPRMD
jgi:hypothetical protein